jgi:hypothetical protein
MRGPADVQHGRADALLTEPELSALYGVPVHEVDVPGASPGRRALVTGYGAGPGRRPLSSGPVRDRSARGHR